MYVAHFILYIHICTTIYILTTPIYISHIIISTIKNLQIYTHTHIASLITYRYIYCMIYSHTYTQMRMHLIYIYVILHNCIHLTYILHIFNIYHIYSYEIIYRSFKIITHVIICICMSRHPVCKHTLPPIISYMCIIWHTHIHSNTLNYVFIQLHHYSYLHKNNSRKLFTHFYIRMIICEKTYSKIIH